MCTLKRSDVWIIFVNFFTCVFELRILALITINIDGLSHLIYAVVDILKEQIASHLVKCQDNDENK